MSVCKERIEKRQGKIESEAIGVYIKVRVIQTHSRTQRIPKCSNEI